jgi:deoxyribose-phosphate aldolase
MTIDPKLIEAAILNKNMCIDDICKYVLDVAALGVRGICFPSSFVNIPKLRNFIEEASYKYDFEIIGVVGYPNGDTSALAKLTEISDLCGFASTLDIVLNPVYIQSGMWQFVRGEMIEMFLSTNANIRWIIETPMLTDEQIVTVSKLILETGGNIKTATGTKGSTKVSHIRLIRAVINESGKRVVLKAASGIKTPEGAQLAISVGADILGCSNPAAIL